MNEGVYWRCVSLGRRLSHVAAGKVEVIYSSVPGPSYNLGAVELYLARTPRKDRWFVVCDIGMSVEGIVVGFTT